jgi:hypothetical protein
LRLILDGQYVLNGLLRDLKAGGDREFDIRKVFSMMLAVNRDEMLSDQIDRRLKVADIKRFFNVNGRLVKEGSIAKYIMRSFTQGASEDEMNYVDFAKMFCPKGN